MRGSSPRMTILREATRCTMLRSSTRAPFS
jgi:hypothetical protein